MQTFQRLLVRIAKALDDASIRYMIIGGQAVIVHGKPRFTGDIDVTLAVDIDRLPDVQQVAEGLSLRPRRDDVEHFAQQTRVFPVVDPKTQVRVDFIFSFSVYEQEAIRRAVPVSIGKTKVWYATAEDTVIHKIVAGRPLDVTDVEGIINIQPALDRNYIMEWLEIFSEITGRNLPAEFEKMARQISQRTKR